LFFERGLLPFVIASQTVPLIALAPLIVGIGNQISFGPIQWSTTYSVMFIAAYLAFFPLSIGALRGLQAPTPTSLELMRSYAATNNKVFVEVALPGQHSLSRSSTQSFGGRIGRWHGCCRNFNGRSRRDRAAHGRVRAGNHIAAGQGLRCGFWRHCFRTRGCRSNCRLSNALMTRNFTQEKVSYDDDPRQSAKHGECTCNFWGSQRVFNKGNDNEVVALSDVNLDVHTGEFISLIGPSGCGKSTLLRVIGDLTGFDSGTVQVSGKTPEDARKERLYGIASSKRPYSIGEASAKILNFHLNSRAGTSPRARRGQLNF